MYAVHVSNEADYPRTREAMFMPDQIREGVDIHACMHSFIQKFKFTDHVVNTLVIK